ncbi:MAG: tripartite tricarboxylate transporter TctB family protein [Hyphomicrobiales bacterium]|nr:tripartite tricarboxylate transporter TctB family protein [Hyphomicrobiales bacterium]MCP5373743.1 tripartite tricarboxylate transporter TctB family protein [Hyphomicrobiales bacterium]
MSAPAPAPAPSPAPEAVAVAGRAQQVFPAVLVLALALWITWVSFDVDDPVPYLFPRLVAVIMLALAAVAFVRAVTGGNQTGGGIDLRTLLNVLPGIGLMFLLVFVLADWLGFYTASTAVFLALYAFYDPAPHGAIGTWARRVAVTLGFMAVMYGLFALVLQVQTPRGLLL